jgi:hypothetical protein
VKDKLLDRALAMLGTYEFLAFVLFWITILGILAATLLPRK